MTLGLDSFGVPEIEAAFAGAGISALPGLAYEQFAAYLALLLKWNERLNLTSLRAPGDIVQRHFIECAFVAQSLPQGISTLLDYGSGAGFPGLPIAICCPAIRVTLGEAHGKKASFLREAARVTASRVEVYEGRVEAMAASLQFDAVTLRAVEKMELAIPVATSRAGKYLVLMTTEVSAAPLRELAPAFQWLSAVPVPFSEQRIIDIGQKT